MSVFKKNKTRPRSKASKREGTKRRHFFSKWPAWVFWLGGILSAAIYLLVFYSFFVSPFSFRWRAIYGDGNYPDGYDVRGIDVSHYQGVIDWELVRNADIKSAPICFAIIKATEGVSLKDKFYEQNFYAAKESGILCGAYHFFTPDESGKAQAEFYLRHAHLGIGDLAPVLDVEKIGALTPKELCVEVKNWLDVVEDSLGVKPIIYTGYKFKKRYLSDRMFDAYPYWIAHYYVDSLAYKGTWHFWQHTDCGRIEGIKGYVDCNVFNGSEQELMELTIKE